MAVLRGNKGVGKAIGGAAAPTASLAPVPLNTPSVKRENNGRDPSINLVPVRNAGVWGQSGNPAEESAGETRPTAQSTAALTKPAPWAKPASAPSEASDSAAAAASKPMPSLRPQTANWADVDVDSDEDDNVPVTSAVNATNHAHSSHSAANTPQAAAAPASYSFSNNTFSHSNNSDSVRKDRSGSFNNNDNLGNEQRRFGGFGQNNYQPQEEAFGGRFNNNNMSRGFGSGDARLSGQPSNDYGVRTTPLHKLSQGLISSITVLFCAVIFLL